MAGMLSSTASANAGQCKKLAQQLQMTSLATLTACVYTARLLGEQPDTSPAYEAIASKAQASRHCPGKLKLKYSL